MYVTRRISDCRRQPELLETANLDGPFSGVLVIHDEEADAEAESICCFGICRDTSIDELPVPQNKVIVIRYSMPYIRGNPNSVSVSYDRVMLIPVIGQPLSENTYYAINAEGRHQGEAITSSAEEETCCCLPFLTFVPDVKSRPLELGNPLQQFQLYKRPAGCSTYYKFECVSLSPGAFPPYFMRREGRTIHAETPKYFTLNEAHGIDAALRRRLPVFRFPIYNKSSERVVVGKWYVPFMFVKENWASLKEQMQKSMYYEMVLEQRWEKVFETSNTGGMYVKVDASIETGVLFGGSGRVAASKGDETDGLLSDSADLEDVGGGVGLSSLTVERMKWEQKRGGWDESSKKVVVEEAVEELGWSKFACYVLVESFSLKRMDGTLVKNFDFYHTHQTQCKWE